MPQCRGISLGFPCCWPGADNSCAWHGAGGPTCCPRCWEAGRSWGPRVTSATRRGTVHCTLCCALHRRRTRQKKPRSTFVLCGCGPLKRRSPGNRVVGSIAGSEGPSRVPSHRLVPRPGLTEHTQPALEFKAREDGCAEKPPCQGCKHCTSLKCVSFTNVRELWPLNTTQNMSFLCVLPLGPNSGKCTSLSQLGLLGAWATHTSDTRPGHKM